MSGVGALLRLRAREIVRTWRIWVLPAVVAFFAVTGPVTARFMREILGAALQSDGLGTVPLPEPTVYDAAAQWTGNLTQIVVLVVAVMAAGAITTELRSGVAAFLLVKPVSRVAYLMSHALVQLAFVTVVAAAGTVVTGLVTWAVFGSAPVGALAGATGVWLVLAAVVIGASLLASVVVDGAAGAAGAGIGAFFVLALLGVAPVLARHTPAGLITLTSTVGAGTQPADHTLWVPVAGGVVLAAALLAGAAVALRRKEL